MKSIKSLVFAVILTTSFLAEAKVKVDYRISYVQSLVDFAFAIANEPHHAPALKEIFEKSKYNTPEMQKTVANIKSLQPSFGRNFEIENGTKSRGGGKSVLNLVITQSIFAKNLQDFSDRVLGLLPMADHKLFFAELKKIDPIYKKLIWTELSPKLSQHKLKLESISKKAGLDEMFAKAETFYNARWPDDTPFVITLYPIPYIKGFKNSSSSQSLGSVEVHGVIVEKDGGASALPGSFGVIFHELCHSLYEAQSDAFKLELEKYFLKNPSAFSPQAYSWFNEAAATAIGNGWAYVRANKGQMDKESWYNHPTIDGYGKEIYPLVKEALDNGQSLNEAMVGKFIAAFEKRFPKQIYSYEGLLNEILLHHDGETLQFQDVRSSFRKAFRISSLSGGSPIDHEKSIESALKQDSESLVYVFSDQTSKQIKKAAESIPYLKENLPVISSMKERSVFSALGEHNRAYILIKVKNQTDLDEALAALNKKEYIDPQTKLWSY